ncbi:MAG TPA: hypothetical protein PKY59_20635 [Pyrinomonadaceae bacterium]|nr:hypothetical protein [Pyrinomonadaceae bacterium]
MRYKNYYSILALIAVFILSGAAFAQVTPPSGIVGWWAGDGDARDISGNGNTGTLQNGVSYRVGKVGQAFQFGGNGNTSNSGDRVIIGNPAILQLQSFTVEAWVRRSSTSITTNSPVSGVAGGTIFAFGQNGWGMLIDQATSRLVFTKVGVNSISSNLTITDTNWHHVAVSISGSQAVFYRDGVADTPINYASTFVYTTDAAIGARGDSDARNAFFGAIDDLAIYNRVLSAAEIQSISNAGVNGKTKQAATNAGANVQTQVNDATLTFANVSTAGTTTDFTVNPTAVGTLPSGFIPTGLAYDISTTAVYSGNVQICFNLPSFSPNKINSLRILQRETNSLVDRTSSTNAAANTVCANVTTLSQFVIVANGIKTGHIVYNRFQANANVDGTIWVVYPNGSDEHFITDGSNPRLSPNGNLLAFKRKRQVTTDINFNYGLWVLNLTTGVETEIFYQGDFLVGFDFTPDSLNLIFDWGCNIYQIGANGSNLFTVVTGTCFDDQPVVNPLNGRLAFHSQNGIFTTSDINGSNRQQVPNTGANDFIPSWSKDGQFLAYIHYDGVSAAPYSCDSLYKIKPDGTGKVLLKNLTGTDRFGLTGAWSPDGTKIYMPARIGGITGIYEVATDGSGTISLSPDSSNLIAAGSNVEFVGNANGAVPTSANISIGGRVRAGKSGVARANVILSRQNGETRSLLTNSFGEYRFDNIAAGETYIISVNHRRYYFQPQIVNALENLTELDFTTEM